MSTNGNLAQDLQILWMYQYCILKGEAYQQNDYSHLPNFER